jgi:hypothetical protein
LRIYVQAEEAEPLTVIPLSPEPDSVHSDKRKKTVARLKPKPARGPHPQKTIEVDMASWRCCLTSGVCS